MSNQIPIVVADFETQISGSIAVGDTSFTLASANDDDGNPLAEGVYCFTINNGLSNKQYLFGDLDGMEVTNVRSINRQGDSTPGATETARSGSPVIISNFASLQRTVDALRGVLMLDGNSPLNYDSEPSLISRSQIATVGYVQDHANGGSVSTDKLTVTGLSGETIAAGDIVYFRNGGGNRWRKADADILNTLDGVILGIAQGAGIANGNINGGVLLRGRDANQSGLTVGAQVYVSNTAGNISSTAGTNARVVGIAHSPSAIYFDPFYFNLPNQNQKLALAGVSQTPSNTNHFVTNDDLSQPTFKAPVVRTYTARDLVLGASTTRFHIASVGNNTFRYTYYGIGANPSITSITVPTNSYVRIEDTDMDNSNEGIFRVVSSGPNFFEITNSSGVAENNRTIGNGSIVRTNQTWTKPNNLKYVIVEVQGAGGKGGRIYGGAGGAYAKKLLPASTLGDTEVVFVSPGSIGRSTTAFGEHVKSGNGANAIYNSIVNGGSLPSGGTSTDGDININGQSSQSTRVENTSSAGGDSFLGFGGEAVVAQSSNSISSGSSGSGYGGGGSGATDALDGFPDALDADGGAGAQGVIIVTEHYI